jgi:hypothetical protein
MNNIKWQSRFIIFAIFCILLLPIKKVANLSENSTTKPLQVNNWNAGNIAWSAFGQGIEGAAKGCEPESKYPAADKVTGFGGLAMEYNVQGLAISEFTDWRRKIEGYPTANEVTITFKAYGPYSIEGSWETAVTVTLNGKEVERVRAPNQGGAPGWSYSPKPVVIPITDEVRKNGFVVSASVDYARSTNAEGIGVTVVGKKCDKPAPAPEPTPIPAQPPTNTSAAKPYQGVSLCEEAFRFWSKETMEKRGYKDAASGSKLQKDENGLLTDFVTAISNYNNVHKDTPAYTSIPAFGGLRALNWLGSEEGVASQFSKVFGLPKGAAAHLSEEFVFNNPTDAKKDLKTGGRSARPGTEPALLNAIVAKSEALQRKLTPGDVLELALEQTRGDVRQALLLVHNTLRSAARPGDQDLTGVSLNRDLFTNSLETIRGIPGATFSNPTDNDENGDNAGPWYHLFGTSYFEMQMRGDIGLVPALMGLAEIPRETLSALLKAHWPDYGLSSNDISNASRFSNAFEQLLRLAAGKTDIDPEKFCMNVWGARIGQGLFEMMVKSGATPWGPSGARKPGMTDDESWDPQHSGLAGGSQPLNPLPPVRELPPMPSPADIPRGKLVLWNLGSPANVTWKGAAGTLILQQRTENLYGSYPVLLLPIYEHETKTWGAFWVDLTTEQHTLTLEAVQTGTIHLSRVDQANGQVATYVVPVVTGERLQMTTTPGIVAPELLRANGKAIAPVITHIANTTATEVAGFPYLAVGIVLGCGALFLLLVVLIVRAQRRRPAPVGGVAYAPVMAGAAMPAASRQPLASRQPQSHIWHYSVNGKQIGPVSEVDLRAWLAQGRVPPNILVWNQTLPGWLPAAQAGLLSTAAAGRYACPRCGEALTPQAKFCHKCGVKF